MKRIGLLISLLFHLILFFILFNARFRMLVHPIIPETIAIVPMYPPLKYYPPQPSGKDAPVVIKPFFIPARPGPKGDGDGRRGTQSGSLAEPSGQSGAAGGGPPTIPSRNDGSTAGGFQPKPVEPQPDKTSHNPPHPRLTIDWDAISRSLGGNGGGSSGPPAPFSSKEKPAALQFGNSWQSGQGIGSGGAGGGDNVAAFGGNAFFDSRGYDITPWAKRLVYRIKRNWLYPPAVDYGLRGQVEIYMVIEKTGAISTLALVKSSMIQPFDQSAVNAMRLSIPLPPLPSDFPNRNLPAYFIFRFN